MAEYVQQTLEEMIPELEEMNNLGLFTTKETKIIKKNRENHEYRLRQLTKTKAAYLNYIDYEKKLLELLKIKRKKIANDSKKRDIEKSISDRIHQLYRLMLTRFQDDVHLWKQHIDFSKALNEKAYVSRLFEKMLKIHSHNEGLWIDWARWESSSQGNNNPNLAREILLRAHRVNPESENLFLEMLHMELQLAQQVIARKAVLGISKELKEQEDPTSAQSDNTAELKLVQILYSKGLEIFRDSSSFHLKMLNIVSKFKEAKLLKSNIISDLKQLYPKDASVWNGLALLKLNNKKKLKSNNEYSALSHCLNTYQEAVSQVNTEEMWTYCLKAHLNLLEVKELSACHERILRSLLSSFQSAMAAGLLGESLFSDLISLLNSMSLTDDAARVADEAVKRYPSSHHLWFAKLQLVALDGDDEALVSCLKAAQRRVPPAQSWTIVEFTLKQLASRQSPDLEELLQEACRSSAREVCCPAKVWKLHWAFRQGSLKKFRSAYSSLKTMRPVDLDFYRLYIEKECAQGDPNLPLIRSCFEESLSEFGLNEPDLWLNYMVMERKVAKDGVKAGVVQERALRGLDAHLKETFIRKQMMLGLGWESSQ